MRPKKRDNMIDIEVAWPRVLLSGKRIIPKANGNEATVRRQLKVDRLRLEYFVPGINTVAIKV